MEEYLFGDLLSLADIKEIEDEKNAMKEKEKALREIALNATKLEESRRTRQILSLSNNQHVKIISAKKSLQENKSNEKEMLKEMKRLRIEDHLKKQSITAGCYKEKNKPPPMHEFRALNKPTDGSTIKYNLDQLKAIGASMQIQKQTYTSKFRTTGI